MTCSKPILMLALIASITVTATSQAQYTEVTPSSAVAWQATANSYYSAQHFDEASATAYFESNGSFSCRWEAKTSCLLADMIAGQYRIESGHCGEGAIEHGYFSLVSQTTANTYLSSEYSLDLTLLPPWVERTFVVVTFSNGLPYEGIRASTVRSTGVGLGYASRDYASEDQFTLRHSANGDLLVRRYQHVGGLRSESYAHCVPRR